MSVDLALVVAAYLLGSVPFSYLVARGFGVRDVRKVGSGNVGATNVLRTAGRLAGFLALLLDSLKGVAATWLALKISPEPRLAALGAVGVVLGHMYPVWLGFRGGKGVSTGAGAFLLLAPTATLIALLIFLLVLAFSRYSSLGSVAAALSLASLTHLLQAPTPIAWSASFVALAIVVKHRGNLERIARGTESRIGSKS